MHPRGIGSNAARVAGSPVGATERYGTVDVARILGVSAGRVRRMVYAGHCVPSRKGRAYRFAFQDLVLLRTAHGLMTSAIPPRRVNRALRQLKKQLPANRPLSGVRIYAEAGRVIVRDRDTVWQPESGQQVFQFAVDELVSKSSKVVVAAARKAPPAPTESATDWFEYGVLIEQDDPNGSRKAYQRALELDSEMTDAYINLGRLVHEGGDPAAAARFYGQALSRAPGDAVTHYNVGVASEDVGDLDSARKHYQQAIEINSSFADAHFNLGRLLERMGNREEALQHLLAYRRLCDR